MTATEAPTPTRPFLDLVRAYVGLTKPRIIELLLVTTVPTMIVAERGFPSLWLVVTTLIGGSLAAGSANTANSYLEQDLDEVMERTSRRPLVNHRVPPRNALRFSIVLGIASFVWLLATVNLLSAILAVAAIFVYVFVYTIGLKRTSTQNIVIGGAAGCFPVLVGWSAVTGALGLPAIVLFLIIFYWTPPHFWALAIRYREDYARAGVPMLPVVAGNQETARQILLYTLMMVAVTLVFGPIGGMGWIYLVAAVVLGGIFVLYAVKLRRTASVAVAMKLFRYSTTYLGLLFVAMAADAVVIG